MAYRAALLAADPAERTATLRTLSETIVNAPRSAAWAAPFARIAATWRPRHGRSPVSRAVEHDLQRRTGWRRPPTCRDFRR